MHTDPIRTPLWALRVNTTDALRTLPTARWHPTTPGGTHGHVHPGLRVVVDKPMRRVTVDWVGPPTAGAWERRHALQSALKHLHDNGIHAIRDGDQIHVHANPEETP